MGADFSYRNLPPKNTIQNIMFSDLKTGSRALIPGRSVQ